MFDHKQYCESWPDLSKEFAKLNIMRTQRNSL
jgi:hypothetical protein